MGFINQQTKLKKTHKQHVARSPVSSFVRVGLQGHLPVGFDDLGQGGHIGDAQLGVVTLVALSSLLASATSRGRGSFRPRVT